MSDLGNMKVPGNTGEVDCTEEAKEEYRIFEFIKTHPELLMGTGSALLVILSALLSFCSYISERAIARFWEIDPVYIYSNISAKLYSTVISFVLLCVLFLIFATLVVIMVSAKPIRRVKRYRRYLRRINFRQRIKSWRTANKGAYSEESAAQIRELSKNIRKNTLKRNLQVLCHLAFFALILTLVLIIWSRTGFVEIFDDSGQFLFMTLSYSFEIILFLFFFINLPTRGDKKTRADARQHYNNNEINTNLPDVVLPLEALVTGNYSVNLKMSDRDIKELLWKGFVVILVFVIGFTFVFDTIGYESAESQKTFWIVDCDGEDYAVVYNNGEIAVLVKAETMYTDDHIANGWYSSMLDENHRAIKLYTYQQKIVSVDTLTYDNQQFCCVIKISKRE